MDFGEFFPGLLGGPPEGFGDDGDLGGLLGADEIVAVEEAVDESVDLGEVGLSEGFVDDEDVGDDEEVAVGDEDVGFAAAGFDDFGGLEGQVTQPARRSLPDLSSERKRSPAAKASSR